MTALTFAHIVLPLPEEEGGGGVGHPPVLLHRGLRRTVLDLRNAFKVCFDEVIIPFPWDYV